jgi:hypothetical protein
MSKHEDLERTETMERYDYYLAETAREIVFYESAQSTGRWSGRTSRHQPGATVYARRIGATANWKIRIPGTLFTQVVGQGAINVLRVI